MKMKMYNKNEQRERKKERKKREKYFNTGVFNAPAHGGFLQLF